jgi:perosamine synthetase
MTSKKIKLFHIPNYKINTEKFDNLLHGKVVNQFEEEFAEYVGAKYAVSCHSATMAIFVLFSKLFCKELGIYKENNFVYLPSLYPPVVVNALINSGNHIRFTKNTNWIGYHCHLYTFNDFSIFDSAHQVDKNQFKEYGENDIVIFSMYPTKPISSCDGCILVSNDRYKINLFRRIVNNGMNSKICSWESILSFPGHKLYMNSISAKIALNNLRRLDCKKERLNEIRKIYQDNLPSECIFTNNSDHLFRIAISEREQFIKNHPNIEFGIHYRALHKILKNNPYYKNYITCSQDVEQCEYEANHCLSIPFHEKLTKNEINRIIDAINT